MKYYSGQFYLEKANTGHIHMMHIRPEADKPHSHSFFELVYVVNGSAVHCMGNERTRLHSGDFFVIDTGSSHCYENPEDFEIVNCLFLPEYADGTLGNCPSLSAFLSNQVLRYGVPMDLKAADRICHDEDGTVLKIIRTMEWEYENRSTGYMEMMRGCLTQLLVHTVRAVTAQPGVHAATAAMTERLRRDLREPLSLQTLSKELGYSPQYLCTVFRNDMGMSLQTYLQRLRVEEACRLLSAENVPLSNLAQAVGYSDAKHFSKIFRLHKGISPREFRCSVK